MSTVTSAADLANLITAASSIAGNEKVFIGLQKEDNTSDYIFDDGTALTFTDWATDEPVAATSFPSCVYVDLTVSSQSWHAIGCAEVLNATSACQRDCPTDNCLSGPCINGGTCVTSDTDYTCTCVPGYTGVNCNEDIDECASSPCMNAGECGNDLNKYTCTCGTGFYGLQCEIDQGDCLTGWIQLAPGKCHQITEGPVVWNNAQQLCSEDNGQLAMVKDAQTDAALRSYILSQGLPSAFIGLQDKTSTGTFTWLDDESLTYENWIVNDTEVANAYCTLLATDLERSTTWRKIDCETTTASAVCFYDATACNSAPCQNGGRCVQLIGNYSCYCASGYTGSDCEHEITECDSSPCQNGGSCNDQADGYTCSCASSFAGIFCELQQGVCEEGWVEVAHGLCYQLLADEPRTWYQARDACYANSTQLAFIYDSTSDEALKSLALAAGVQFHIGLIDYFNTTEAYYWLDWAAPNYTNWIDPTTVLESECFTYPQHQFVSPKCYFSLDGSEETWDEAFAMCAAAGGKLAQFEDVASVNGALLSGGIFDQVFTSGVYQAWLGLKILPSGASLTVGNLFWVNFDGSSESPFDSSSGAIDMLGVDDECAFIISPGSSAPLTASARACNLSQTFICEREVNSINTDIFAVPNYCVRSNSFVAKSWTPEDCATATAATMCYYNAYVCDSLPCMNNGTCSSTHAGFTCNCTANYTGYVCEALVNSCDSNPCQNDQECVSLGIASGYYCNCSTFYTGYNCQLANFVQLTVATCYHSPNLVLSWDDSQVYCRDQHATLVTIVDAAAKSNLTSAAKTYGISQFYLGASDLLRSTPPSSTFYWEDNTAIDPALASWSSGSFPPTQNNYWCSIIQTGLSDASLSEIWMPTSCSVIVAATVCQMNCTPNCDRGLCQNSGTCIEGLNNYVCICPIGFTGFNCETNIDDCVSVQCENGATCIDQINSYSCQCSAGYTGIVCETNIDECEGQPCENGATCVDGINEYTCQCTVEYTGVTCATGTLNTFFIHSPKSTTVTSSHYHYIYDSDRGN
uniref:Uncharacterized protein n=1 Tax=Plectus sambesii TaxID=2011161 RepID=A0A914WRL7_9BILA